MGVSPMHFSKEHGRDAHATDMKITNIECIPVQAPGRTLVPILVHTDEGLTGVGEAGLQRRWRAIDGAVEHFRQWLVSEDPMRIEYLW